MQGCSWDSHSVFVMNRQEDRFAGRGRPQNRFARPPGPQHLNNNLNNRNFDQNKPRPGQPGVVAQNKAAPKSNVTTTPSASTTKANESNTKSPAVQVKPANGEASAVKAEVVTPARNQASPREQTRTPTERERERERPSATGMLVQQQQADGKKKFTGKIIS